MGSNHGKQHGEKGYFRRRSSIRKILRIRSNNTSRPVSYAGIDDQSAREHPISLRPLSMYDALPFHHFDIKIPSNDNQSSELISRNYSTQIHALEYHPEKNLQLYLINKLDENDWKIYIPLTLEKLHDNIILKDLIYSNINEEFLYILNRLFRLEKIDNNHQFLEWFFDELEDFLHARDSNPEYQHSSLLLRSIEQDRYYCTRYILDRQLLPSKLHINTMNDQGRHCLLMLAHKNGPIDLINYLLINHSSCLDTNKLDLNQFSALHHSCRHFNLSISQLLLSYTNKKLLQIENSELHTPLDYWLECLCSLKKLKPTYIQHHSEILRLDYLLRDSDYHSNVLFFQTIINYGGQLTKIPLRYIRSILPQLTFEQKVAYVDHHVHLCCTLYKNRLSTLIRDYDNLKISIQAGEILTEFIYALGTVQLEVQNRYALQTYSGVYENAIQHRYREENSSNNSSIIKDHENLQLNMRMLYFKFFRLFQCIYNNPDVNVKNFHFEHIFRRVWIYWKEPVRAFISQCREKNSSLKSICRIRIFKRLNRYPMDIQYLPINTSLKQFLAYDNQFFVIQRNI